MEILQQVLQPPCTLIEKIILETAGQPERDINDVSWKKLDALHTMCTGINQLKHSNFHSIKSTHGNFQGN